MSSVITPKAPAPDVAGQITYAMRSMGVAPIPRNYELFYEAYIGSNPALTRDLAALGGTATQEELDALGAQYFTHNAGAVFDNAHTRIVAELDNVLRVLRQEQNSLESYNKLLGETVRRINSKTAPAPISFATPSHSSAKPRATRSRMAKRPSRTSASAPRKWTRCARNSTSTSGSPIPTR
jgi:hypothetical protein